jgi:hypothetical protein
MKIQPQVGCVVTKAEARVAFGELGVNVDYCFTFSNGASITTIMGAWWSGDKFFDILARADIRRYSDPDHPHLFTIPLEEFDSLVKQLSQ